MRNDLHVALSIRLFTDRKCFGPGVAELLCRVAELHSLRAAAAGMEMAYSKAWKVVKNAEDCLGCKLLNSSAGGRHGGGATLTPEAERLLDAYGAYCQDVNAYARERFEEAFAFYDEA